MVMPIPFVGPAYKARSNNINAQRCVNLYLEPGGPDSKSPAALIGTPGLRRLVTLPNAPCQIRGMEVFRGAWIVVAGNNVYSLNAAYVPTLVGAIGTATGQVSIATSVNQYIIVDGVSGWVYDQPSNVFAEIADDEFPKGAKLVSYLSGMAIVEAPASEQYSWSKIGDFRAWDGLDFSSAEGSPDFIVSHTVSNGNLWLLGETTTEVAIFTESGFARGGAAPIEVGCAAPYGVVNADNSVFWIGRDAKGEGTIWRAQDYRPVRVSDFGVEFALASYERLDDAIAFTYQQEGHLFVVFTFPSADATWVLDIAAGVWHERAGFRVSDGTLHRHRANCHVFYRGENIVGDYENGRLYAFDLNKYDDDETPIMRLRATATLAENQRRMFYGSLHVDIESGVGLVSGQGADPKMMLRFSTDNAHTWSNRRDASMGKLGEFGHRCRWNRLGSGRNRVWEISITDPVKVVITGAYADLRMGN